MYPRIWKLLLVKKENREYRIVHSSINPLTKVYTWIEDKLDFRKILPTIMLVIINAGITKRNK